MLQALGPNLFRIPVPLPNNPLKELNSYLITGPRSLLIDTGFRRAECREAITAALQEAGVDMARTDIFLTHLHTDHTGLAPELAVPGTRLLISELDRARLPGKYNTTNWLQSDRFFLENGMPQAVLDAVRQKNPMRNLAPPDCDLYEAIDPGTVLCYGGYRLEALWTPGHTPGHLCLWDAEQRLLFAGDHVLFDITPNITKWRDIPDALGDYRTSLVQIRNLPAQTVLPGHRGTGMSLSQRVDQLLRHHERRCQELLDLLADGRPRSAYTLAAGLHWDIRGTWETFPPAQQWFAMGETAAHLDHLYVLGQIVPVQDGKQALWMLQTTGLHR